MKHLKAMIMIDVFVMLAEKVVFKVYIITWKLCKILNWKINGIQIVIFKNLFLFICIIGFT
jgi:hypothetical protein